ncbi:uncharacterized protein LOC111905950 [Lactuca sativa]|uniref:uncharacterized protein LOC111905950 n=1 Tax=Lactuca sativa TaxID=4236 RepID=UPI000CD96E38|nr:uncharacterized protein LOC111905950 [Lactuca sativa]
MEGLSVTMQEACEKQIYEGVSLPNRGPILSHVVYADDVTFVGLKVNLNKSKVFGIGVQEMEVSRLANILCCEASKFPFTYLGLPIGANMKLAKHWRPIVDKFKNKLSNWKANNLLFGGRFTLVKSVLGSLPLFYFSLFKASKKVIENLESIRRNFLWGKKENKRKINWVAWNTLTKPKRK